MMCLKLDRNFEKDLKKVLKKFDRLTSMDSISPDEQPKKTPKKGVYFFSEGDVCLYVGRSNNVRKRYKMHVGKNLNADGGNFAFKIARGELGRQADELSRKGVMELEGFEVEFRNAKKRIKAMGFRCVRECDQRVQALLEHYAIVALGADYNDFGTH